MAQVVTENAGGPMFGSARVTAEVNGEPMTFVMDMLFLAEVERKLNAPPLQALAEILDVPDPTKVSVARMIDLVWCGLKRNHPQSTYGDAADFLQVNPAVLRQAAAEFFPQGDDADPTPGKRKPARQK